MRVFGDVYDVQLANGTYTSNTRIARMYHQNTTLYKMLMTKLIQQ